MAGVEGRAEASGRLSPVRALFRLERFIERLVEQPSARLFGTRLQPIQVLRRIEQAMESGRNAEGKRMLVPDEFHVRLNPDDLAGLQPAEDVAGNLASGALTFARDHGYALRGRPSVTLEPDASLRSGAVEVGATVSPVVDIVPEPDQADGGTRVFEVPVVRAPEVVLAVQEPGRAARRVPVSGAPIRIGRAPECEIVLKDSRVSRRHARLHARDGVLLLTDLGSTNGTRVNGHRVTEVVLGAGDRISVGDTSVVVEAAPTGAAASS
jgi:hypothetical protein